MKLSQIILDQIEKDFEEKDHTFVTDQLLTITLSHVMANSEGLLESTRRSILNLAQGDLKQVEPLVQNAKTDFRDIIYWNSKK